MSGHIERLFSQAEAHSGVPSDHLKLIACLFMSVPLSSVFVRLPRIATVRHVVNLAISAFYLLIVMQFWEGAMHMLASTLLTYYAVKITGGRHPGLIFLAVMGHLVVIHLMRTFSGVSPDKLDHSGSHMVLVMKLTAFAYDIYDGLVLKETEREAWQTETCLTEVPSLLAFLGHAFFFPAILTGPTSSFRNYNDMAESKLAKQSQSAGEQNRLNLPRGRRTAAYTRFGIGLGFLAVFSIFDPIFNYYGLLQPSWRLKSVGTKLLFIQGMGIIARCKYYSVWSLSEGAFILTGMGFNGYTKESEPLWDKSRNIDVIGVEFAPNIKMLLDSWNKNTNVWLRNYVYRRVSKKGKKPGFKSTMCTFMTSAIWHGTAAGYYLTFLLACLLQTLAKDIRSTIRPLVLARQSKSLKRIYDVASIVCSQLTINYLAAPFIVLNWHDSLTVYKQMGWYGHLMTVLPLLFFWMGGKTLFAGRGIPREKVVDVARSHNTGDASSQKIPKEEKSEPGSDGLRARKF